MKRYKYDQIAKAEPTVTRYKLYKSKTKWVVRGATSVAVLFGVHELQVSGAFDTISPLTIVAQADTGADDTSDSSVSNVEVNETSETGAASKSISPVATVTAVTTEQAETNSADQQMTTSSSTADDETTAESALENEDSNSSSSDEDTNTTTDADEETSSSNDVKVDDNAKQEDTNTDTDTVQSNYQQQIATAQQQAADIRSEMQTVAVAATSQANESDTDTIVTDSGINALNNHVAQEVAQISAVISNDSSEFPEGLTYEEYTLTQLNQILQNMKNELDTAKQMLVADKSGYDTTLVETAQAALKQVVLPTTATAKVNDYGDLVITASSTDEFNSIATQIDNAGLTDSFRFIVDPTYNDGTTGYTEAQKVQLARSRADYVLARSFANMTIDDDPWTWKGSVIYTASNITQYNLFAPLIAQLQKVYYTGTGAEISLATAELGGAYTAYMNYNGGDIPTYDDQQQDSKHLSIALIVNLDQNGNLIATDTWNKKIVPGYILNSASKVVDPSSGRITDASGNSPIGLEPYGTGDLQANTYYAGKIGDEILNPSIDLDIPNFKYVSTEYTTGSSTLVDMGDQQTVQLVINHWEWTGDSGSGTTTTTALSAKVGNVTKTADGTTLFSTVPTVQLTGLTGAVTPTLTADDFDWSNVQAAAGTYSVTLNSTGIAAILAANADTTLAANDITAGQAIIKEDTSTTPTTSAITALVGNVTKTYDTTATFGSVPTVTLSGKAGLVSPSLSASDFDWSGVQADAGGYKVSLNQSGIDKILAANTDITLDWTSITMGDAIINKATVTVTPKNVSKNVGDTDPALTADISGIPVGGETADYSLSRDAGETAGTYTIKVTNGTNRNYTLVDNTGTFTIKAVTPTTTAIYAVVGNLNKTYDGTINFNDVPTVTISGITSPVVPTLTKTDFDWTNVEANAGSYKVSLNQSGIDKIQAANANTFLDWPAITMGDAVIDKATVTITPNNLGKNEGESDPALTAKVTGKPTGGATVNYSLKRETGETAGTYEITVVDGTNTNYTLVDKVGTFTIKAVTPTTTAIYAVVGDLNKTYDGTTNFNGVPTVTISGITSPVVPTLTTTDFDWTNVEANAGSYKVSLNQSGIDKIQAANANTVLDWPAITMGNAIINKTTVTITPDNLKKDEGENDPKLTAKVTGQPAGGATVSYSLKREAGETAGTYDITVVDGTNTNYTLVDKVGTFTIKAVAPTVTALKATVGNVTKSYDGKTIFSDLPTVKVTGISNAVVPTLTTADFDWAGVQANAGSYKVTLKQSGIDKILAANANTTLTTNDVTAGNAVINKATVTITPDNLGKDEGESDPKLTAQVTGQPTSGATLNYSLKREAGETAGTYDITVVDGTNTNYTLVDKVGTFTIKAVAPTVTALKATVGNVTKTYDGKTTFSDLPAVKITGISNAVVSTLTTTDFDWTDVQANAGSYKVTLKQSGIDKILAANANTTLATNDVTAGNAVINKATVTITPDNLGKNEGASDPVLTATVTGKPTDGATVNYSLKRETGETAGTYDITVVDGTNANYTLVDKVGTFTIKAVAPTVTALKATVGNVTKTYDGETTFSDLPTVKVTGISNAVVPTLTTVDFDWTKVQASAGSYKVTLKQSGIDKILAANANTTLATNDVTAGNAVINKATVTITPDNLGKNEGASDPTLTATVTGKPTDGATVNYSLKREAGETAGTYDITVVDGTNANYTLVDKVGTFTIKAVAPTVTALKAIVGNVTKTYDGKTTFSDLPTVKVTGISNAVVPTLTTADFDWTDVQANAGSYKVTLKQSGIDKILAANANTTLTTNDVTAGNAVINKATVTITPDNLGKDEGESDPKLTAQVTGQPTSGATVNYSLKREAGETAGTYDITVVDGTNANYTLVDKVGTFTIKAVAPTVTALKATVGNVTKTYDGTVGFINVPEVKLTGISNAVVPTLLTSDFNWDAVEADAGQYKVTLNQTGINKILAANANTKLDSSAITMGNAVINKATVTITPGDLDKNQGESDPALTATVTGKPANGATVNYNLRRVAGETAGTYDITVVDGTNTNYTLVDKTGTFTIKVVAPTITALEATVGDVSKTYDGKTTFSDLPTVKITGISNAVVPTLTTTDFDWTDVQANAGSYKVTLKQSGIDKILAGNANTSLTTSDVTAGNAVVNKADVTITPKAAAKTEGEADPKLTATVNGQPTSGVDVNYDLERNGDDTPGIYTISVKVGDNPNYNVKTGTANFTVNAETTTSTALTAVIGDVEKIYDGTTNITESISIELTGRTGITVPSSLTVDDFDWSNVAANVGTYEVTLKQSGIDKILAANTDTTLAANDITAGHVTVTKAKVTVTAEDATKVVGESDPTFEATVDGKPADGVAVNYSLSREAGEAAGSYIIEVIGGSNDNYDVTVNNGELTITEPVKTAITAKLSNIEKAYDGTTNFTSTPDVELDGKSGLTTPTLSSSDFDWSNVEANAGSYQVTLNQSGIDKIVAANGDVLLVAGSVTAGEATINKATITVEAKSYTKTVGDTDPVFTAGIDDRPVNGEDVKYTLERTAGSTVGEYVINVVATAAENPNYNVITVPGKLTITASVPTINALKATVNAVTKTYDGTVDFTEVPEVVVTEGTTTLSTPQLTADDFDWSDVSEDVGSYNVTLNNAGISKILAANVNTSLVASDVSSGKATIEKADVTLNVPTVTKKYDGKAYTDTIQVEEVDVPSAGDKVNYSLDDVSQNAEIGEYPISVTLGDNPNYNVKVNAGKLIISKDNYQLVVNYVDGAGNVIASSVTEGGLNSGANYSTSPKSVEGYYLTATPSNASGTIQNSESAVNYVYAKVGAFEVTSPSGATTTTSYLVDKSDPTVVTADDSEVVSYVEGYKAVVTGSDAELELVDKNDKSKGYQFPDLPADYSKSVQISYLKLDTHNGGSTTENNGTTTGGSSTGTTTEGTSTQTSGTTTGSGSTNTGVETPTNSEQTAGSSVSTVNIGPARVNEPESNKSEDKKTAGETTSTDKQSETVANEEKQVTNKNEQSVNKQSLPQTDENTANNQAGLLGIILASLAGLFGFKRNKRKE